MYQTHTLENMFVRKLLYIVNTLILKQILISFAFLDHMLKKELDFTVKTGWQLGIRVFRAEMVV